VFIAYGGGYPTTSKALLWRVGAARPMTLDDRQADHVVSLAAAPDGRLWVFWVLRSGARQAVYARRSNAAATAFGPAVSAGAPPGQQTGYKISGSAQRGRLDLVGLYAATGAPGQWHTQVLPGLAVKASPATVSGRRSAKVTFRVSNPDPVQGAKVSAAGKSATTDAKGRATIALGPTSKRTIAVTVTKSGYTRGGATLRVRR
jgi:hypothetical protein